MQISLDALQTLIATAFENSKVAPDTAQIVAKALVRAEADGISSHGVARVPPYAEQAKCGKVDGFAKPSVNRPRPAVINVDSHIGFAFPAIELGLKDGIEAAKENGVAPLRPTRTRLVASDSSAPAADLPQTPRHRCSRPHIVGSPPGAHQSPRVAASRYAAVPGRW